MSSSILTAAVRGAMAFGIRGAVTREHFGDRCVEAAKASGHAIDKETIERLYELYKDGKIGLPGEEGSKPPLGFVKIE